MTKLFKKKPPYPAILALHGVRENQASAPKVLEALRKILDNPSHWEKTSEVADKFVKWAQHHHRHFSKPVMDRIKAIARYDFKKDEVFTDINNALENLRAHTHSLRNPSQHSPFMRMFEKANAEEIALSKAVSLNNLLGRIDTYISIHTIAILKALSHSQRTENEKLWLVKTLSSIAISPFEKAILAEHRNSGFFSQGQTTSSMLASNLATAIEKTRAKLQPAPELVSAPKLDR